MSKYYANGDDLTSVADAIRTKGETSDPLVFPAGFVTAIAAIPTGGGDDPITKELAGETYSYTNNDVEVIYNTTVFSDTTYVEKITMNKLRRINRSSVFKGCGSLKELHLPALQEILTGNCICSCSQLEALELGPTLKIYYYSPYTFSGIGVTSFTLPPCGGTDSMSWLPEYFLANCSKLTYAKISEGWTRVLSNVMRSNSVIKTIDLPTTITEIGSNSMCQCPLLDTVICRATTVPTMASTSGTYGVFGGSKIAAGTGYIYVPDAAVEDYKAATNWSTYAAQIKGLSELPAA